MAKKNEVDNSVLENAIGGLGGETTQAPVIPIGTDVEAAAVSGEMPVEEKIGDKARVFSQNKANRAPEAFDDIDAKANRLSYRTGWTDLPKAHFGVRAKFYPEDWSFRVRPATVEAIKNWSVIDEENILSVDNAFNEILKSCFAIRNDRTGEAVRWDKLHAWDRFWVILKIREYSMPKGESKVEYEEDCPDCGKTLPVTFASGTFSFDLPDEEIIEKYWDQDFQRWTIDPEEYDVQGKVMNFYNPTIEKVNAIMEWNYRQQRAKRKVDEVFLKFLPYMLERAPKDEKVFDLEVKKAKGVFESWTEEQFLLADDILRNIMVTPARYLTTRCPHCGEEVRSDIRFPNGLKSVFDVSYQRKKFGTK